MEVANIVFTTFVGNGGLPNIAKSEDMLPISRTLQ
jgi:hypothetical protein